MPKSNETWYDRQALISKLITYAAMLILLSCFSWSVYLLQLAGDNLNAAILVVLAGIAVSAFLAGVSAIIDLHIVNAEALRAGR